jgi:hypothetical protein
MFWLRGGCLVYIWLIFQAFLFFSPFFSTTLHRWFGLSHPSIVGIRQCVCTHPIKPMSIHFLHRVHDNKHIRTHDIIHDTFVAIAWDDGFHMGWKHITCISFNHIQLLLSISQHCVYQRWHSYLSWHCHCRPNANKFKIPILCNPKICYFRCNLSQRNELLQLTPH